jgi:hypothetical protein
MEYKEFKVTVLDEQNTRATLPSGQTRKGKVDMDYLKKRTIKIFDRWLAKGKIEEREELRVFGSHLYKILFNGDIDQEFKKICDEIERAGEDVYLRLVLEFEQEAQELASMPWEYIYYPDTDRQKGFQIGTKSKLILARQVPLVVEYDSLKPHEKPLRILIVVCQPEGEGLGQVLADPVIDAIEELKDKAPDAIQIHRLIQPDGRAFLDTIKEVKPHVLHFIGHGAWDKENRAGKLAFVNRHDNSPEWISDEDFADFFEDFSPRLNFLHACEGASSESYEGFKGLALQLVYSKVPAVVAMQYPIKNKAAIKFATKFYECLGEGKPIAVAVQVGRHELGMYMDKKHYSSRAFGSPVVYLQYADDIIVAEAKDMPPIISPTSSDLVRCPNRDCPGGRVELTDRYCARCRHKLVICPNCGWVMSEIIGVCVKCTYGVAAAQSFERQEVDYVMEGTLQQQPGTRGHVDQQIQSSPTQRSDSVSQRAPTSAGPRGRATGSLAKDKSRH